MIILHVELKHSEGFSINESASIGGRSLETATTAFPFPAKTIISRARARMRQMHAGKRRES